MTNKQNQKLPMT